MICRGKKYSTKTNQAGSEPHRLRGRGEGGAQAGLRPQIPTFDREVIGTREERMNFYEDKNRMHAQILNLRSAMMACASAIYYFPPCGRPGGNHLQCPEARAAMQRIYEEMKETLLLGRTALDAVFRRDPQRWDLLSGASCDSNSMKYFLGKLAKYLSANQEEFIRSWGEVDHERFDQLGTTFSEEEWEVLSAKGAWQHRRRLTQITSILAGIEDAIAKLFDSFDSVLDSGLLGDCEVGKWVAEKKKTATA